MSKAALLAQLDWRAMAIPPMQNGVIDNVSLGVQVAQRADGREVAQAWAYAYTDTETRYESPVYLLNRDADMQPFSVHQSGTFPIRMLTAAAQAERMTSAAVARAIMAKDERSPLDMIQIARDLRVKAQAQEREYQHAQEQAAEQARQDNEARAVYALWLRGKALAEQETA